ncbi:MAG: hypothetical protein L3J09_11155 [Flavobacteriaceae bacterium]|nr:hypothetical protein [Flavobacteriaceae bacterium]
MKLVIITAVEEYHNDILQLFKESGINNFSESGIDGYKNIPAVLTGSNWFAANKGATNSILLFSFNTEEKIEKLFDLIKEYNSNLETNNPIRAIMLPIEKHI